VIVEQSGNEEIARIVDFGVAILRDGAASKEDRLTTGGLVIGTPHYMAPELATGKPFDHRIDLFALGVMLYEMLTGVMPFDGTGVDVALKNLKVQTPPMSLRAPGVMVDPLLEALTHKLMAKKADDRPASAKDVRVLLDLIASDREAAALVLGVALPEAPRLAQASVPPPVAAEDVPTTDEMIAVSRPRWTLRIAAAALLIAITVGGFALIGRQEASAAVDLDIAAETPAPAIDTRAVVTEVAPPVSEEITAVPVGPAIPIATPMPGREVTPPKPAPAIATTGDVRGVIELYQTVARQLKAISDRRDMAADDLWQRYRLIRIQDAITSTGRRAEVQTELLKIQRAIDDRFAAP
jgi:serine/threonine-protein kinase